MARASPRSDNFRVVGHSETNVRCHLDEKSPFRPCGRDLVQFFNSTGWAFYVQWWCQCGCRMLRGSNLSHMPVSGQCDKRMLLGALCPVLIGYGLGSLRQLSFRLTEDLK